MRTSRGWSVLLHAVSILTCHIVILACGRKHWVPAPAAKERSGGSAWESNPAPPRWQGATGFEDREGHRRAPFAST